VSDPLHELARRAEGRPFFLAHLLAVYAESEGLDDDGLAATIGCAAGQLTKLRLSRAPRGDAGFGADVDELAGHFGLDWLRLAVVVRHAQALVRMRQAGAAPAGTLLAARDAGEGPEP
jgi:hypothetical protein